MRWAKHVQRRREKRIDHLEDLGMNGVIILNCLNNRLRWSGPDTFNSTYETVACSSKNNHFQWIVVNLTGWGNVSCSRKAWYYHKLLHLFDLFCSCNNIREMIPRRLKCEVKETAGNIVLKPLRKQPFSALNRVTLPDVVTILYIYIYIKLRKQYKYCKLFNDNVQ